MQRQQLPYGKLVTVKWVDSMSHHGWHYDPAKTGAIITINTVGYVVNVKDAYLTLSSSMGGNHSNLDPVSIPWGAIEELKEIEICQPPAK